MVGAKKEDSSTPKTTELASVGASNWSRARGGWELEIQSRGYECLGIASIMISHGEESISAEVNGNINVRQAEQNHEL